MGVYFYKALEIALVAFSTYICVTRRHNLNKGFVLVPIGLITIVASDTIYAFTFSAARSYFESFSDSLAEQAFYLAAHLMLFALFQIIGFFLIAIGLAKGLPIAQKSN